MIAIVSHCTHLIKEWYERKNNWCRRWSQMYEKYNENSETIYDQLFMSEEADDDGVG